MSWARLCEMAADLGIEDGTADEMAADALRVIRELTGEDPRPDAAERADAAQALLDALVEYEEDAEGVIV